MVESMSSPIKLSELPREEALRFLIEKQGLPQEEAEEVLAIARGDIDGDVVLLGSKEANKGRKLAKKKK